MQKPLFSSKIDPLFQTLQYYQGCILMCNLGGIFFSTGGYIGKYGAGANGDLYAPHK
jgi:hypothetical protein